jgi:hypothetical protein
MLIRDQITKATRKNSNYSALRSPNIDRLYDNHKASETRNAAFFTAPAPTS